MSQAPQFHCAVKPADGMVGMNMNGAAKPADGMSGMSGMSGISGMDAATKPATTLPPVFTQFWQPEQVKLEKLSLD